MTKRIMVLVELPDALAPAWLQHVRDFDTAHAGCQFRIVVDAPDASLVEMVELLKMEPPLAHQAVFKKAGQGSEPMT